MPPPSEDATARRRLAVTITAIMIGQFLATMNATIVVSALPRILDELDGTAVQGTWMFSGATLTLTVAMPVWGRLADRVSPIRLFVVALVGVIVPAVTASLATAPEHIIVSRAVQGSFMAGVITMGTIILANVVAPQERGRYLGWLSSLSLAGMLGAPLLGGLLVESPLGWRACFYAAVPLVLVTLVLLRFSARIERFAEGGLRIDVPGVLLLLCSLLALQLWVTFVGASFDLLSWPSALLGLGGLAVLAAAIAIEWRSAVPILPLRLLRGRILVLAPIAALLFGVVGWPASVLMTLYFQSGRGITPALAGLLVVSSAVGTALSAFIVGTRTARTGRLRRYLIVGAALLLAGPLLIALAQPDAPLALHVVGLFLIGLGQGATVQFTVLAAQNEVGLREVGSVSAFMGFIGSLGGASSLAVSGAMLTAFLALHQGDGLGMAAAYLRAVPETFWLLVAAAVVGLVAVALLPSIRLRTTLDLEESAPGS